MPDDRAKITKTSPARLRPRKNPQLVRLGERVRALRKNANFSQEAFAYHVGLHPNYLGGIERGERNVAVLNIIRIAEGLGISVSELFAY